MCYSHHCSHIHSTPQVGLVRIVVSLESPGPADVPHRPAATQLPPAQASFSGAAHPLGTRIDAKVVTTKGPTPNDFGPPARGVTAIESIAKGSSVGGSVADILRTGVGVPPTLPHEGVAALGGAVNSAAAPPAEYQVAWELEVWKRGE